MNRKALACWLWVLLFIASIAPAQRAAGQCEKTWLDSPAQGLPGVHGEVFAWTAWDPDGAGPEGDWLVVGGEVGLVGSHLTPGHIAAWDGRQWRSLGTGLNGFVFALAVLNGELIAGGEFTTADGLPAPYIAAWNGSAWRSFGTLNNRVRAFTMHEGRLIAGGEFTGRVASWDGTAWRTVGSGLNGRINALTVYRGDLYAGGRGASSGTTSLGQVLRWDGSAWSSIDAFFEGLVAVPPVVNTLRVYQDELIAGGFFYAITGVGPAGHIAAWNGAAWRSLGAGVSMDFMCCEPSVNALGEHDGRLIVAGNFETAGGMPVNRTASWNGSAWSAIDTGYLDGVYPLDSGAVNAWVWTVAAYKGEVVIAGSFRPPYTGHSIIAGDGASSWHALGTGLSHDALAFVADDDMLFVGGGFGVARRDMAGWNAMGRIQGPVRALAFYNGELIAGGSFKIADGQQARGIARWEGSRWVELGGGIAGPFGCCVHVYAMIVYGAELIIAGEFSQAGGTPAANIVRWNGSGWSPLGSGTSEEVLALAMYNGELIAGGKFESAGDGPAFHIARWDGSQWRPLGRGVADVPPVSGSSGVYGLTIHNGELIAAGNFFNADSVVAWNIARWNGTRWAAMGEGIRGLGETVYAVASLDGELYATGYFSTAGGVPAAGAARWDGQVWRSLGAGLGPRFGFTPDPSDPIGRAMTVFDDELIVGGEFELVEGRVSAYWARWGCPPCPIDYTGDGVIDFADYLEFLNRFEAMDPSADLIGDGVVDFSDYLEFLSLYDGGC